jgi:hypothetical protein
MTVPLGVHKSQRKELGMIATLILWILMGMTPFILYFIHVRPNHID